MVAAAAPEFFIAGGNLPLHALSYVPRQADHDLAAGLKAGQFCYVLTSRQMGKSSLMVRTAARLRSDGIAVAVVDLTVLGRNLTARQWYDGLAARIGRQFDLEDAVEDFCDAHEHLSPLQRCAEAIEQVILPAATRAQRSLILFLDEIDVVGSLPFPTDELFAWIRSCYNRRAEEPALRRLTFCLLGVASPADLIADPHLTPFNIGRRIALNDFRPHEAAALAPGLAPGRQGAAALQRVLHWTGGHPYMTQRLCRAVVETAYPADASAVDAACARLFLDHRAWEQDENLLSVRKRLLHGTADPAGLLDLYDRIRRGKTVLDEDADNHVTELRLAGIVRAVDGRLLVRNRIYVQVFDGAWVAASLPDADLRRLRAAYRRGVLRTLSLSAIAVTLVGGLGAKAVVEARHAERGAREARGLLYDADLLLASQALEQGHAARAQALLDAHRREKPPGFVWRYLWKRLHRERLTLSGHTAAVDAVAVSPDSRVVATGSANGQIVLWDLARGEKRGELASPDGEILCLAFSPDGRWLVSGSDRARVTVWDWQTRRALRILDGFREPVSAVVFSPNGRTLAAAGNDGTVRLWDLNGSTDSVARLLHDPGASGAPGTRVVHAEGARTLAFSPHGTRLATAGLDHQIKIWDMASETLQTTLRGHTGAVNAVAFSPDGTRLASCGEDATLRLWDVATGTEVPDSRTTAPTSLMVLRFSPDGRFVFTGGGDGALRIWAIRQRRFVDVVQAHASGLLALAVSPDGRWLVTGSWDDAARVWSAESDSAPVALQAAELALGSPLAFSPGGKRVAAQQNDGRLGIWDAQMGRRVAVFNASPEGAGAMAFRSDEQLAVASRQGGVFLLDARSGRTLPPLLAPQEIVFALAFSPDGRWMATSDAKNRVRIRDLRENTAGPLLAGHGQRVNSIAFSPDGRRLATGSEDKTTIVWDRASGRRLQTLSGYDRSVSALAFSHDARRLATGNGDGSVRLWDVENGRELLTLAGGKKAADAVSFAPGDGALRAADRDGIVQEWRAATPQEIRVGSWPNW